MAQQQMIRRRVDTPLAFKVHLSVSADTRAAIARIADADGFAFSKIARDALLEGLAVLERRRARAAEDPTVP